GFLALYFKGGNTFDIPELINNGSTIAHGTQLLIFGGLFMGFAIKVPMFPFHTWLPDAHTEAPTVGSVILAAALLKLGTYGFTGMLFFLAGSIHERFHTRELSRLGGLLTQAPKLGWILGFCAMASLGLPGLAGFWGEFPVILSAYNPAAGLSLATFRAFMVVASVGTVFAAGYLLWMFQRTAFGTPREEFAAAHIHDVHGP